MDDEQWEKFRQAKQKSDMYWEYANANIFNRQSHPAYTPTPNRRRRR